MKLIKLFEEFIADRGNERTAITVIDEDGEGNFKFQKGQTYKYQLIDAMGKDVTQKTVTIVPNSYYPLEKKEIFTSGVIKIKGNHNDNLLTDNSLEPPSGIGGLDLQSTDQPNVFSHPDFKTIYQVKVFPN